MAVTPDNATLIVAESYAGVLTAYDIADDGNLSDRRVWADLAGRGAGRDLPGRRGRGLVRRGARSAVRTRRRGRRGAPDHRFRPGLLLLRLGGPERTTLFVTAAAWPDAMTPGTRTGRILTAQVDVPGAGWPG